MRKYLVLLLFLPFLFSCANKEIKPIEIPKAEFEKTEPFKIKEDINKPEKPDLIQLDSNFDKTNKSNNIKYFAFTKSDFAKIVALSKAFDSQQEIIDTLENLVNIKIKQINSLKELIAMKENLADHIAVLYANEQEMRQLEQQNYKLQKLMDRVFMVIQGGVIVALALAI